MSISDANFDFISKFAYDRSAIVIAKGKEYLVESRLNPLSRKEGYDNLDSFLTALRTNGAMHKWGDLIVDALTTNETFFFRDIHPFAAMEKIILPELISRKAGQRHISIWSGASSTGQEAYSIAMMIHKHFPELHDWKVTILGTDISRTALLKAQQGIYSQLEVNRGLPANYLVNYFEKVGNEWVINEKIRHMVDFQYLNLCGSFSLLRQFDIIFLRNVLIYFDIETKKKILNNLKTRLDTKGVMFLGTAETTMNIDAGWQPVKYGQATAYQLPE